MSWTTPQKCCTGNIITAADWNSTVVDNLNDLKQNEATPLQAESSILAVGALALSASATSREVTRRGFLDLNWLRRKDSK